MSDDVQKEERQQRSRERNREHARRTRLRKKAQLASLQLRVSELQSESKELEQALLDCTTAKILVGLATNDPPGEEKSPPRLAAAEEVLRVSSDEGPLSSFEDSNSDSYSDDSPSDDQLGGGLGGDSPARTTTIHWKNGYALDEHGHRKDLSPDELDSIRRERNRLHAKLTRDRKKVYVETLSRAVANLEDENKKLRDALTSHLGDKQPKPLPAAAEEQPHKKLLTEEAWHSRGNTTIRI
eukprot:CAMPEP_0118890416 /NCGR_PEP_ID=MMETSP1166-20130328/888_1 /TAXON_ID=1104430 /ORGANISM="Chrysoreinhardia sp, Strain CCMP3193" /LENGTH=239 /DNA_ID=CAMNT_0006829029 /DNA_START=184 /DNA_END=903 /DNA_ORIENTATION=+